MHAPSRCEFSGITAADARTEELRATTAFMVPVIARKVPSRLLTGSHSQLEELLGRLPDV